MASKKQQVQSGSNASQPSATVKGVKPTVNAARHMPKSTGKFLPSEMLRVDRDFAQYVRDQARIGGVPVTEVTRVILQSLQ